LHQHGLELLQHPDHRLQVTDDPERRQIPHGMPHQVHPVLADPLLHVPDRRPVRIARASAAERAHSL
jgi:hypothetical protein